MEDQEDAVSTKSNLPALCEECKSNPSKYKCPGCSIRSCSLHCVKAHKHRTGCTGKRHQTNFIPLSQFDDNILLSDYNMLEDVKRVAESAQRMREKLCGYYHFRLPFFLKGLQKAAANRRTKLLFLSSGMTKRKTNQSCYDNRKKSISWTIEWRFHSTDVVLIDHRVHENTNLYSVIENHLKPGPWNHRLRQFCEEPLDSLKFFIRKYPKGPRSPFRKLDLKSPIRQQLADLVILEYPVIHVFLPSHNYDFEVIKDAIPHKPVLKEPVNDNHPSTKGLTFREEEIEDGSSSDPKVLVLMQHVKPDTVFQIPHRDKRTEKEVYDALDKPLDLMQHVKPDTVFQIPHRDRRTEKEVYDALDKPLDLMQHVKPDTVFQIPHRDRRTEKEVYDALDKPLDLMQHVKPDTVFQIPHRDRRTEKEVYDTLDKPLLAKVTQVTKPVLKNEVSIHKTEDDHMYSSCQTKEAGFFEDMDFVFEQGLMDAYSDLMAQTNPDEFLDFEDMFTEEVELEGREDHPDFSGLIQVEEELEEGEIPGS